MLQRYFSQSSFKDILSKLCYRNILVRVVLDKIDVKDVFR